MGDVLDTSKWGEWEQTVKEVARIKREGIIYVWEEREVKTRWWKTRWWKTNR